MATLEYTVTGQKITTTKTAELVKHMIGYYTVQFTFDSTWDAYSEKWAVFDPDFGEPLKQPLDASGQCDFPGEVMNANRLKIGVYGVADGVQYPTIWTGGQWLKDGAYSDCPISEYPEPESILEGMVSATKEQSFTDAQKEQARENIGALGKVEGTPGNITIIGSNQNIIDGGFKATEAFPVGFASGAVVTIEDGADGVPIKSMTVQIEPVQAGSGDPSPRNVRPISGWTKGDIYHGNEHVIEQSSLDVVVNGVSFRKTENGFVRIYGTSTAVTSRGIGSFTAKQTTYYFSGFPILSGYFFWFLYDNTTSSMKVNLTYSINGAVNDLIVGHSYALGFRVNGAGRTADVAFMPVISTVPTEPTVYELTFPDSAGTVYGGSLTVHEDGSGTLTVNKVGVKPNNLTVYASLNHGTHSSSKAFTLSVTAYPASVSISTKRGAISESSVENSAYYGANRTNDTASANYMFAVNNTGAIMRIYDPDTAISDADFTTKYGNALFVYPIEPVTYQLTAPQVSTLFGLNNIWADTGNISIEYHADPTIFVEGKTKAIKQSIAPIEDGYTASQAYAVGSFLFVGDTLYKVTSAIASGATITPNTNVTATTVAEQLIALA